MDLVTNVPERRRPEPSHSQAGRPLTVSVKAKQLSPTLGGNQERPREGSERSEATPGWPALRRLAGPTCRPLMLPLGVEVKRNPLTSVQLTPSPVPTLKQYK